MNDWIVLNAINELLLNSIFFLINRSDEGKLSWNNINFNTIVFGINFHYQLLNILTFTYISF